MADTNYSIELHDVGDRPNRFQVNPVATLRRTTGTAVNEGEIDDDTFDDEIVLRNNRRSSR